MSSRKNWQEKLTNKMVAEDIEVREDVGLLECRSR